MPEIRVRGYTVRAEAAGPDAIRLKIGKKTFLGFFGETGELSLRAAGAAIEAIRSGLGSIAFAGRRLRVSSLDGGGRLLSLEGRGAVALSHDEAATVIEMVQQAVEDAQAYGRS